MLMLEVFRQPSNLFPENQPYLEWGSQLTPLLQIVSTAPTNLVASKSDEVGLVAIQQSNIYTHLLISIKINLVVASIGSNICSPVFDPTSQPTRIASQSIPSPNHKNDMFNQNGGIDLPSFVHRLNYPGQKSGDEVPKFSNRFVPTKNDLLLPWPAARCFFLRSALTLWHVLGPLGPRHGHEWFGFLPNE